MIASRFDCPSKDVIVSRIIFQSKTDFSITDILLKSKFEGVNSREKVVEVLNFMEKRNMIEDTGVKYRLLK